MRSRVIAAALAAACVALAFSSHTAADEPTTVAPVVADFKPVPTPPLVHHPVIRLPDTSALPSIRDSKRYARRRLTVAQFECLRILFNRESGWRTHAGRPSGAYGIPQALPGRKMAVIDWDWKDNPVTQVHWGMRYIKGRYGSPCRALLHSDAVGWY